MGSNRVGDERFQASMARHGPITLPMQAYGGDITWGERKPVWAWVQWPHKPAERIEAWAKGWNDRVVVVEWAAEHGTVDCVVWRNAVTMRQP